VSSVVRAEREMRYQGWGSGELIDWWQREFTGGADPEYTEQILPLVAAALDGRRRVLDLGTGEGQVARRLRQVGCSVIGVDPVAGQLTTAVTRGGGVIYLQASADGLPFADASFDGAVACLVLEHIDALDDAVAEVARVLEDGGRFLLLLNHPLLQTPGSGWIDDQLIEPPEQYWRIGPYLPEAVTSEEIHRDVFVRFIHRPLSRYLNALLDAGLWLERMEEPPPPPGFLALAPRYPDAADIPRLLALHLVRREAPDSSGA
jgi:SAM-dependent methyltransferase